MEKIHGDKFDTFSLLKLDNGDMVVAVDNNSNALYIATIGHADSDCSADTLLEYAIDIVDLLNGRLVIRDDKSDVK